MSKAIKFKNNTYLDSSSITHNKVTLQSILNTYSNRKFLEWKETTEKNFNSNTFYTPGIYSLGGVYSNAPYSGDIYGTLLVLTNNGSIWKKTDTGSWLWQIIFNTGGKVYQRVGVNSTSPGSWQVLH